MSGLGTKSEFSPYCFSDFCDCGVLASYLFMLVEVTAFKAACAPGSVDTRTLRDGHCGEGGTMDVGVFELCNIVSGFSFTPSTQLRSSLSVSPPNQSFCAVLGGVLTWGTILSPLLPANHPAAGVRTVCIF